jgi:hypothetical protein
MENDKFFQKVDSDINEDVILCALQKEYDVFGLLDYNEFNIKERIEKNPFLTEQFRLLLIKEKSNLMRLQNITDEYIGTLYDNLKHHNTISLGKVEIEKYYLPKDPKVIELKRLLIKQSIRVDFFEAVFEAFKTQGWLMKQWLVNNKDAT